MSLAHTFACTVSWEPSLLDIHWKHSIPWHVIMIRKHHKNALCFHCGHALAIRTQRKVPTKVSDSKLFLRVLVQYSWVYVASACNVRPEMTSQTGKLIKTFVCFQKPTMFGIHKTTKHCQAWYFFSNTHYEFVCRCNATSLPDSYVIASGEEAFTSVKTAESFLIHVDQSIAKQDIFSQQPPANNLLVNGHSASRVMP